MATGLHSATNMMQSFGGGVLGLAKKLGPLAVAFTGVAGAAGIMAMVKSSFSAIDSLAKMADAVGLTTEALAGLRRAGDRSGVSANAVDKGFARMQRSISAAAAAGVSKNFSKLGLDLERIRSMKPEDQFFTIAESINNVADQTDKTRLAMETFGRDGIGILKIVGRGADAARKELAKAAELGMAPSREDAAKIEAANDAIADMKDSFMGVANSIAVFVAPTIQAVAEGFTRVGILTRKAFESVRPLLQQFGNVGVAAFNALWSVAGPVLNGIGSVGSGVMTALLDLTLDFLVTAEFVWSNFGAVAEFAWERTMLGAVSFYNDLEHILLVQIPEIASWTWNNFGDIAFTAFDYAATIAINFGDNLRNMFGALWKWISSGFTSGLDFDWKPLSEGFVSTIKEMPELAGREIGAIESALMDRVSDLGSQLGGSLADLMQTRRAELFGGLDDIKIEAEDELDLSLTGEAMRALEGPAAVQRDSAEAFSSILSAQRQAEADPMKDIAKTNEQSLGELRGIKRALERQRPGIQLVAGDI